MDGLHHVLLPLRSQFPCRIPPSHCRGTNQIGLRYFSLWLEQRRGPWWCFLLIYAGFAAVTADLLPEEDLPADLLQNLQILPKIIAVVKQGWIDSHPASTVSAGSLHSVVRDLDYWQSVPPVAPSCPCLPDRASA